MFWHIITIASQVQTPKPRKEGLLTRRLNPIKRKNFETIGLKEPSSLQGKPSTKRKGWLGRTFSKPEKVSYKKSPKTEVLGPGRRT